MDQLIGVGNNCSSAVPVRQNQCIRALQDEVVDDSDKSITVENQSVWEILGGRIRLTTTAVVGNRNICIEITNSSADVYVRIFAPAVQAASLTWDYILSQTGQFAGASTIYTTTEQISLPSKLLIPQTWIIRIYDIAAIDAAADDLFYYLMVKQTRMDPR